MEGQQVAYEQKVGEPVEEGLSIGVWSSAGGTITSIEKNIVAIEGGAVPIGDAVAEAEAEARRQEAVGKGASWW
jgi:hypothetical protein